MKKKAIIICLCMAVVVSFSACKVADEPKETEQNPVLKPIEIETSKEEDFPTVNYIQKQIEDDEKEVKVLGELSVTDEQVSEINELIQNYGKEVSFKAVSENGNGCLSYNSDADFFAASTIKAAYIFYCYSRMESGDGALMDEMVYTSAHVQEGSGSIKESPVGTVYSAKNVLYKVMQESDNAGYLMCVSKWGKSGYNDFVNSIGCDGLSFVNGNIWAENVQAEDFVRLWSEIHQYFQQETELSKIFYQSCINPKTDFFGDSLSGSVVAQKYGISTTKHTYGNTAIVYGDDITYFVSLFTRSDGEASDKRFVKELSGKIHEIMK